MMVVTYYSKSFIIISCSIFLFSFLYNFSLIHAHGGASHDNDESSPPHGNLHSNSLIRVKIWCLLIFFFATFFPGISPYYLRWNESFLILGTQFSAGVFFATALLHFLSDASSTFETLTDNHYPFSYMLVCAGYLLTMLTDLVVAYVAQKSMVGGTHQISGTDKLEDGDEIRSISNDDEGVVVRKTTATAAHNPILIKAASFGDSILLILALCFHSVFEGIAVGIADNEADAWRNLWTILLHKVFAAIAMGIALLRMIPKRPFLTTVGYSFAFAISSPVGIGIGIAINATTQGKTSNWIFAISMSLACGIFIYVAINHLIAKGYKPAHGSKCYFDTPIYKYLALVLGVFVISVVMNWD